MENDRIIEENERNAPKRLAEMCRTRRILSRQGNRNRITDCKFVRFVFSRYNQNRELNLDKTKLHVANFVFYSPFTRRLTMATNLTKTPKQPLLNKDLKVTMTDKLKAVGAKGVSLGKRAAAHVGRNKAAYIAGGLGAAGMAGIAALNRKNSDD
jgi:hypothetical protein